MISSNRSIAKAVSCTDESGIRYFTLEMATRGKNVAPPAPKKPAGFNAKNYEKPGLTEDEVIEIKEAFDLFDTDGGGSIDPKGNHQRST